MIVRKGLLGNANQGEQRLVTIIDAEVWERIKKPSHNYGDWVNY